MDEVPDTLAVIMGNLNIRMAFLNDRIDVIHPEFQGEVIKQMKGYNKRKSVGGDLQGNYTNGFGGKTPLVARISALTLSVHPNLSWMQVREILACAADKIGEQSCISQCSSRTTQPVLWLQPWAVEVAQYY